MRRATRHIAPILTALLLAIAGVTFVAAPAQANIGTEYHGGFWYTDTDNNTVTVSAVEPSVTGGNPVIPTSVTMSDGNVYTVTSIADHGMKNRGLTGVTIPASVIAIGPTALDANPGLEKVRFLGNAPATITDGGTATESFDTASGKLRVYYAAPTSSGFTGPTWHGYTTVPQVSVASLDALQGAPTFMCPGEVAIKLTADLIGDNMARFDVNEPFESGCNVELDLNGHDLTLRHIQISSGNKLTIDNTSAGTPGTVTAATTDPQESAIQHNTGATLVIDGGEVHASSLFGAGIGGGNNHNGGTTIVNGGTVTATSNAGAGIGGGDNGNGGTITVNGGTVTASSVLGAGIGGGSGGSGGTVVIGDGADVTASGHTAIGAGDAATTFGSLLVSGTLRVPLDTFLRIPPAATVTVNPTGVITGDGAIAGGGTIENSGAITLPTDKVTGGSPASTVTVHHYQATFDSEGGTAVPSQTVFASTFTKGARTLPTPTKAGYTFDAWNTGPNGSGSWFGATSALPGPSGDGSPVPITLYAMWSLAAPTLTGDATSTGEVGTAFVYTPTLVADPSTVVGISTGALPDGLTINTATGAITGTPTAPGIFEVTLKATNGVEPDAELDVEITINEHAQITGAATASGQVGTPFTYTPTVTGYPAPGVSLDDGTLPAGLTLNGTTGAITGTPTAAGTFEITVEAENSAGTDSNDITITIADDHVTGLAPTITGSAREGQTLTAHEGPVVPNTADLTYQWNRYGTPIPGATDKTYKATAADVGRKLSVTITADTATQAPQTATSALTGFVSSPNKRLILNTSTVKKGQSFNLIATGLKPKQTYIIWLSGKRSYIGFTDANGMVATSVKFPTSTKPGTRRVRVSGYTNGKRTFTVYTHVQYTK